MTQTRRKTPLGGSFWAVWTAGSISYAGDGVTAGALPLLAASLTRDPRLISLVEALTYSGWLLLGLVSGVVADRVDRLGLMWRVDVIRGVLTGALAALVLSGRVDMGVLLAVSLLLGMAAPFFDNASASVLPDLVTETLYERANSATQMSMTVLANLVGPPLGAVVFVVMHGAPFVLDAASFGIAAVIVGWLARRHPARRQRDPAERTGLGEQLREGLEYLRSQPALLTLAAMVGVINMVTSGVVAILVLYVLQTLRLPETTYGVLVAVFALGGVGGALVAPRMALRFGQRACLAGAMAAFGLVGLSLGLVVALPGVVAALFLGGVASVLWNVVTISFRQRVVPRRLLGRVTSVYRMLAFLAIPVGAAGTGLLAHAIGIRPTYVVGGVVILVALAVAWRWLREVPGRVTEAA